MRTFLAPAFLALACTVPAHADRAFGPAAGPNSRIAIAIAPEKIRAPYDVQVIRENGDTLPTYAGKGRYYVQGNAGERYIVRVTNPTPNRVEAVVTVDGLDVIDGENGDLRKRGYVVPPYGDVRIEGFRTSQADVATFRFSSVNDSYAGQKGKARNVGVIAVAIFEEQGAVEQNQIIVGGGTYGGFRRPYDVGDDIVDYGAADESTLSSRSRGRLSKDDSRAKKSFDAPARAPRVSSADRAEAEAPAARRPAPPPATVAPSVSGGVAGAPMPPRDYYAPDMDMPAPEPMQRNNRPGLGTEFGESRYSAASFTRFVRAAGRPIAIAELRYNNLAGLIALGIHADPLPDANEIMLRETADPFPGDGRFAMPPR